jgi:3-deoxy-D-manno-octulosonic-acid transferase
VGAQVDAVLGNLKFDVQPDEHLLRSGCELAALGKPVLLFASSREGEEAMFSMRSRPWAMLQAVQWLIVPRHPQRFDEWRSCWEAGFAVSRRSQWGQSLPRCPTRSGWRFAGRDAAVLRLASGPDGRQF